MDGKTLARLGAIVFVAVAITAAAIELTRKEETPPYRGGATAADRATDPLQAELRRCQQLGEAGPRDTACLRAWADNRDRFLAPAQPIQRQEAPRAPGPQSTPLTTPLERDPAGKETAPASEPQSEEAH